MLKDYMTTKEAAKFLGYHSDSVCNLCIKGKLPGATKFGKSWAIPRKAVEGYEKGPQGFAADKERKEAERQAQRTEINAAIRFYAAKKLAIAL